MAVAIRLARGGAKKRPYYRIVVSDTRSARDGKYLEQVGVYNPVLPKDSEDRVKLIEDRIRYWLGVGAQPTDRVARFLDAAGIQERAARNNPKKAEPGEKAKERAEEKASRAAEAEEARLLLPVLLPRCVRGRRSRTMEVERRPRVLQGHVPTQASGAVHAEFR